MNLVSLAVNSIRLAGCVLALSPLLVQAAGPDAPPLPEADSATLRYRFQPGRFVHYSVRSESRMALSASETTTLIREKRDIDKHYRVVSVDASGNAVLEPVIDRAVMKTQTDDQEEVVFDSGSSQSAPPAYESIRKSIGKAGQRVRYAPNGRAEHIKPVASPIQQVAATESSTSTDQTPESFLLLFPDHSVRIGAGWNDDFQVSVNSNVQSRRPLLRSVTIRRRYVLEKIENGVAHIRFSNYPIGKEDDPQIQLQLIRQTQTGRILFDLQRGMILEWTSGGIGQVFGAFGPSSSMHTEWKNVESYVASPKPNAPARPAGPALPPG